MKHRHIAALPLIRTSCPDYLPACSFRGGFACSLCLFVKVRKQGFTQYARDIRIPLYAFALAPAFGFCPSCPESRCFQRVGAYAHIGLFAGSGRPGFRFGIACPGLTPPPHTCVASVACLVVKLLSGIAAGEARPGSGLSARPGCCGSFPIGQAHCTTGKPIFQLTFTHIKVLFLHRFTHILPYFSL